MPLSRPRPARLARPVVAVALSVGALMSTGCYTYRPAPLAELTPATEVRLQLTAPGVERLRSGPESARRALEDFSVSGKVARVDADSVVLSVPSGGTSSTPNVRAMAFEQPLSLLRSEIRGTEIRRLDRKRTTWSAIILGTLTLAAAVYAIERGGEATGSTPTPGGPNEARIPLMLRIR